jgi:2-polyprenyl-3-methyl-5-hydroxy-6-metoxy-1,4-benzoquinol methylase
VVTLHIKEFMSLRQSLINTERRMLVYNSSIAKKIAKNFPYKGNLLEFGAGIGTLATLFETREGLKPKCLEIDPNLKRILVDRGFKCYDNIQQIDELFDGVYTSNVLEHIEDDVHALQQIRSVMKPQSNLVVYVPAFQCLYSSWDASVGHHRRYDKKELLFKLDAAGFEVIKIFYVDTLGFFASFAARIFGYKGSTKLDEKTANYHVADARVLIFYDRLIYRVSRIFDFIGFRYILGKNLFVVAKVKKKR